MSTITIEENTVSIEEQAAAQPETRAQRTKAQQVALQEQGKAAIEDAFSNFTTAVGQAGAGIASAEASAVDFVNGIALLRQGKVTQAKIAKTLAEQAKDQGVDVPFTSSGYITIAEVVGALIAKGDLGTVTRKVKVGEKFEKVEHAAVVRVDGFAGTKVADDEAEVFGIVRAVVSPQGVPFLAAVGVKEEFFGKGAALDIINESATANDALRQLDARAQQLKNEIAKGKKLAAQEKAAKKAAEVEVTGDTLIADLAAAANAFAEGLDEIGEGTPVIVSEASADALDRLIKLLVAARATGIEVVASATV